MKNHFLALWFLFVPLTGVPQTEDAQSALQRSVEELRTSAGRWSVQTDFLNEDGTVARSVQGVYEFSWVVPDRVLAGQTAIPEMDQAAGILFYINEKQQQIAMVSVGADGRLWIMNGPVGENTRYSEAFETADGGTGQLRFTRFNVQPDAFESRMEYTEDGGKTWKPGNHQQFTRMKAAVD